ncbi:hypothetical protein [Catenulispora rubra]|uniref:hypothetical protein n=1 Tax=Catenulispora rubra TaxID=280293 RepID=UPI001892267D|nr:hypothetical protein [Catenulispora rubra]
MRKAILPGVGVVVMAATLAGCGSSGKSTGVGLPPLSGHTSQQAGATSGGLLGGAAASSSSAAGPCQKQVVVTFCEKIDITGAMTVSGTAAAIPEFDQGAAGLKQTCATWPTYQPQNPDDHTLALPTDPVDGHKLLMVWPFPAGVGTTDISKYAGTNSISVDNAGFQDVAVDVNNTTASSGSVQVNPDGSGSLSFKDLAGETGKISGTITWTCVDSQ